MIRRWMALAIAWLAMSGTAAAAELAPGNGRTLHLGSFDGTVYYTVEQDGYHVVATLASGAEAQPIRFIARLGPGQSLMISVPQAVGEPSLDFEIVRIGEALFVGDSLKRPLWRTNDANAAPTNIRSDARPKRTVIDFTRSPVGRAYVVLASERSGGDSRGLVCCGHRF